MLDVAWQDSLFPVEHDRLSFDGGRRDAFGPHSWIDLVPGWVPDHAALFDQLLHEAPWQQRRRQMCDHEVLEPRLTAGFPLPLPDPLEEMRLRLSERYGVAFDSCWMNLYRDGNDAVAWHGDTVRKTMRRPLVVTISLGSSRRFLVRRRGGGPVLREYAPGQGDLMVMGGRLQHDFDHAVPRDPRASGARISVTMRHSTEPDPPLRPRDLRRGQAQL
jgi:alkylated DNA repair dioxygenase AlkB